MKEINMKKIVTLLSLAILASFAQADNANFSVGNVSSSSPVIFTCLTSGQQLTVPSEGTNYWPRVWQYCPSSNDVSVSVTNPGTTTIMLTCWAEAPFYNPPVRVSVAPNQTVQCPTAKPNAPWIMAVANS